MESNIRIIGNIKENYILKNKKGKIKTSTVDRSSKVINRTLAVLSILTVLAFLTFDYKDIVFAEAIKDTFKNIGIAFFQPYLTYDTFLGVMGQLLITFSLGFLATFFGAIISFFISLLCANNISNPKLASTIKAIVSFIRAVPTVLWVLIFAVSAGLGSVAAVIGLTFHSVSYLVKSYAEAIEEVDYGTIEALKASGASYWQIVFQGIIPSTITYIVAWTFMRFEINFANAVAMGAAAGAGGIGYGLFMSSNLYFDLHETGYLTIVIVICAMILEFISTKIKETLN